MKKVLFLFALLITVIFLSYQRVRDNSKIEDRSTIVKSLSNEKIKEKVKPLNCVEIKKIKLSEFENTESMLWTNSHIKYVDGFIYRIRYFYDDGPNGQYKKTILYKEDENEFPHIVKTFRGFEKKSLKKYLKNGEVIHEEKAFERNINGQSIYWKKINNKIVGTRLPNKICL